MLLQRLLFCELQNNRDHDCIFAILSCITLLFHRSGSAVGHGQTESKAIVGRTIYGALEVLSSFPIPSAQQAASQCVFTFVDRFGNQDLLRTFLPGIFSRLALVCISSTTVHRPSEVLVCSLKTLTKLSMVACAAPTNMPPSKDRTVTGKDKEMDPLIYSGSVSNVNEALAKLSRLCHHEKDDVVDAFFSMCVPLLKACHGDHQTRAVALKLLLKICGRDDLAGTKGRIAQFAAIIHGDDQALKSMVRHIQEGILEIRSSLQSSDQSTKHHRLFGLRGGFSVLEEAGHDLTELDQSVMQEVMGIAHEKILQSSPTLVLPVGQIDLFPAGYFPSRHEPFDVLSEARTDDATFSYLRELLATTIFSRPASARRFLVTRGLRSALPQHQAAQFWCGSRFLEDALQQTSSDRCEGGQNSATNANLDLSGQYFDRALKVLCSNVDTGRCDWRLEALALEIVAFHSRCLQEDFRPELTDVLFPLIARAASGNSGLRQHALRCLGIVSCSCGYPSAAGMLLENADYLVNAIALRLNMMQLGCETTMVLGFLLENCGSNMIPFLGDAVDSIVSVLAAFHGYSRLLEDFVGILNVFVHQTRQGYLTGTEPVPSPRKLTLRPRSVAALAHLPEDLQLGQSYQCTTSTTTKCLPTPDESDTRGETFQARENSDRSPSLCPPALCNTIRSIVRTSQYFLGHDSVKVRRQLLRIVEDASPLLACDEDAFLPLLNEIWPAVVLRLFDNEPLVSIASMRSIASLVRSAGDFMSSRIEEQWSRIQQHFSRHIGRIKQGPQACEGFSHIHGQLAALTDFLVAVAAYVKLTSEMEDDIFAVLGPTARGREDVREVLEHCNADKTRLLLKSCRLNKEPPSRLGFDSTESVPSPTSGRPAPAMRPS